MGNIFQPWDLEKKHVAAGAPTSLQIATRCGRWPIFEWHNQFEKLIPDRHNKILQTENADPRIPSGAVSRVAVGDLKIEDRRKSRFGLFILVANDRDLAES
jgi:hypothetical protein